MHSILFRFGLCWITIAIIGGGLWGFTVTDPNPLHGPTGSSVTIEGAGFDPEGNYTVTLGDLDATVGSVSESAIEITLPSDAESGFITVSDGLQSLRPERAFLVTRKITVQYSESLQIDVSAYDLGTIYSQVDDGEGPAFTLDVDTAGPSLVIANQEGDENIGLYGIARTDSDTLEIGSESTVEAFAFISSLFYTADEAELANRVDHLREQSTFTSAVSAVDSSLEAGRDYLDSASATSALEAMLIEFVETYDQLVQSAAYTPPTAAIESQTGYDYNLGFYDLQRGYPRELLQPPYEAINRLVVKPDIQFPNGRGLPVWKMKIDPAPLDQTGGDDLIKRGLRKLTANPLDWAANVYVLDVNDPLIDTPQKAEALRKADWDVVYDRLAIKPVDRLVVSATPATRYLDVASLLKAQISQGFAKGVVNTFAPDPKTIALKEDLTIPTEVPGIFMIRSFSGASFPEQDNLIAMLPGGTTEDHRMKVLNIMLAINDTVGFFIGQSNTIESNDWAKFLLGLEKSIGGKLSSQTIQGGVSSELLLGIFWETVNASSSWLVNQVAGKLTDALGGVLQGRFGGLTKFIGSVFNVSEKAATVGKVLERMTALTNASRLLANNARIALAVEDTLVVIGNPWAPLVTSFRPTKGYQGTEVTLIGEGFSTEPLDNIVTIGRASTDPQNPSEPTRAEVLGATGTTLQIRLPEDAGTGTISVTVEGSGTGTTVNNPDPFMNFVVIPDPEITEIIPAMPVGGTQVILKGTNFPTDIPMKLKFSGSGFNLIPDVFSETEMFVTVPAAGGEQDISLTLNGRTIGSFPVEVEEPVTPPESLTIIVTSNADSDSRDDGKLTVREAFLLAEGTLSVASLSSPPDPRVGNETYETDFVTGPQLGAGSKNTILVSILEPLFEPVVLSDSLSVPSHTVLTSRFDIEAGGLGSAALIFDGTVGAEIDVTILNAGADGVLLTEGARNNKGDLIVKDPGGHGIILEGEATGNRLTVAVSNPGKNAVYLTGEKVIGNGILVGLETGLQGPGAEASGAWGIVLDNGASYNRIGSQQGSTDAARSISGFPSGGVLIDGSATRRNKIGLNFDFDDGFPMAINNNGGDGIRVEGPGTELARVNIYGNVGHGIEVAGAPAAGTFIWNTRIGYASSDGTPSQNEGSGIHVSPGSRDVLIGSLTTTIESEVNSIGGNRDHGIHIEGPDLERIRVNAATIGTVYHGLQSIKALGNGMHGIALTDGASGVLVGNRNNRLRTFITNHENGAGIYLHGNLTRGNTISGAVIGKPDDLASINLPNDDGGNAIGIHITGGAHGNQIGLPGELVRSPEFEQGAVRPWNEIHYNDIGILIESGGDPTQTVPTDPNTPHAPRGANVVVNNRIGHIKQPNVFNDAERGNGIGIKLTGQAAGNRIGGRGETEGNLIHGSKTVGILIDGLTHSRPDQANRIIGNEFEGTGLLIEDSGDPRDGLTSAAILLTPGTSNQIIGGDNPGEGNTITNGLIGIGLDEANANIILGNEIGGVRITGFPNSTFTQNRQVGIFLRNSSGNRIGPGNIIAGNGLPDGPALGGLYLQNSDGNYVMGNRFGLLPVSQQRRNNPGNLLLDNSGANQIGFHSHDGANIVGLGIGPGIHLFGEQSRTNRIENNYVGTDENGAGLANSGDGVLIEAQAASNLVSSNTIHANGENGVHVDGDGSISNTISLNSITGHDLNLGIRLGNSGNDGIEPPELTSGKGLEISGTAPSDTPDGSEVAFFYDPGNEGLIFIGSTTVQNEEFTFNAALSPGSQVTSTLTDPDGNTSEFSPVFVISQSEFSTVDIRRTEEEPEEREVPTNRSPIALLPMVLTAPPDISATIASMTFKASGSIDESSDLKGVALYRDEDDDGLLTSRDTLITAVEPIGENDGEVTLSPETTLLSGSRETWLLAAVPEPGVAPGSTLGFQLVAASKVESKALISGAPITETGAFPIVGDTVTLTEPVDAYDEWRKDTFSPEDAANDEVSGRNADPDEDGIPNLLEFALGTLPGSPDLWNDALISVADGHYIFQFPVAESLLGLEMIAEATNDLVTWNSGEGIADIVGPIEDGSGGYLLVVKVPIPANEATLIFARLVFEP